MLRLVEHVADEFAEQELFAGLRVLLGVEDLLFLGAQVLGDEPLGIHHRLLADVVIRHVGEVALRDLDEVAERAVVADLEVPDAGALLFRALELRQPAGVVALQGKQAIEFLVEAGPDIAAIGERAGQFVAQGAPQEIAQVGQVRDARGEVGQYCSRPR